MIKKMFTIMAVLLGLTACSGSGNKSEAATGPKDTLSAKSTEMTTDTSSVKVKVETSMGPFTILLYGDTPKHRDNFLKHVNEHYYDSLLFHRVIKDFMVQAGDPESKNAPAGKMLGGGDPGYTLEAEIDYPKHFHKRGALAAARTGDEVNPERRSSGSQFYVVTGKKYTENQLGQMEAQMLFQKLAEENKEAIIAMQRAGDREGLQKLQNDLANQVYQLIDEGKGAMPAEVKEAYMTVGGTPHLDGAYTVFGEVIDGMDTIDRIQEAQTSRGDRPVDDIRIISMEVEK